MIHEVVWACCRSSWHVFSAEGWLFTPAYRWSCTIRLIQLTMPLPKTVREERRESCFCVVVALPLYLFSCLHYVARPSLVSEIPKVSEWSHRISLQLTWLPPSPIRILPTMLFSRIPTDDSFKSITVISPVFLYAKSRLRDYMSFSQMTPSFN